MKLSTLQALVAAVEDGSLRSAARRLGVSQPALTKMIRELEIELAAPLLVRTSQGVLPTAQGQVLFEHALKVSRELLAATDQISQLGGHMRGELNIGVVPVAVMLLIPETLRTFGCEFPDIKLRVSEELYIAQLQRLRSGQVDIAVGGIPGGLSSGEFITEELMTTSMVVVVRKGSPLAKVRRLAQLADAKWVYTSASNDTGYAQLLFESHGLAAPPVGAVVNSTLTLISLVGAGDYVGLMPLQIAQHPLTASYISIVPIAEAGLPLKVGAIIRSDSVVSPAVRHFIAHLHRAAHQLGKKPLPAI
ncbi:MAG: LysR family transcriptional regulator [Curvibacter sp. GWA2_64_110]|nr:MAG: LysR family transcriptional regulator [Curvibacter sp. GWA2_64_110]HCY16055.1 LysR family transcriptional regulator [Curvibacter sp.]